MSWSSQLRVLGVCGVWLALQTGCGGDPTVNSPGGGTNGGADAGGTSAVPNGGSGGSLVIPMMGGDGTTEGGDGTGTPTKFVCGNGMLEPGEFCDDGNTADDDGCSGDCKDLDLDYDCSVVGQTCVKVVICGDGVLQGAEACDDKNTMDGDGCSADCGAVEDGWVCVRPGNACVKLSICGNGVRERGEACDDSNADANDGCDDKCQIETGYFCPNPGMKCVKQVCGDGVRTPGEACDDGNTAANDGCAADCKMVEDGWHCNVMGCKAECGDGVVVKTEACDDGNAISGDGCSSACKVEPFFKCNAAMPSKCTASSTCGNGILEPIFDNANKVVGHEICDPPSAQTGCNAGCTDVTPVVTPPMCGNSVIEGTEACDPPDVGNGCKANCTVEPGYTCPQPGVCFKNPVCGDSVVQPNNNETCDPPKVGMGCDATCKVEAGWTCAGFGPSVCVKPVCGNGVIEPGEKCDDGNGNTMDGCANCAVTAGWACPAQGIPCIPKCGDGMKLGTEECDDGAKVDGDGCNAGCKVEPGFKCPNNVCVASVCGDGTKDVGEGCDDSNKIAGDGCGPTCQPEPTVTVGPNPTVNVSCGDGLKTGTEECDDGNKIDGDGCNADCTVTNGYTCTGKTTLPTSLQMKVTYRDFKSAAAANGHPDFMYDNLDHVAGITGGVCTAATGGSVDKTKCGHLDVNGKPELIKTTSHAITGIRDVDSFGMWYRDGNPSNFKGFDNKVIATKTIVQTLTLNQVGGAASETYVYDAGGNNFYPINGAVGLGNIGTEGIGCGRDFPPGGNADEFDGVKNYVDSVQNPNNDNPAQCFCTDHNNDGNGACLGKNYGFTTEIRYFFQYKGGETLTFSGDDDVWVYVNGRVAVDIGGLHPQKNGQVLLGDDGSGGGVDSDCSAHSTDTVPDTTAGCYSAGEKADNTDSRFGLTVGGVYEIVLFQAERHVDASNFKLTLAGFLAPRSFCSPKCGDGVKVGDEFCDDGAANSDTASGACNTSCNGRAFCGDGIKQLPGEACDNGTNTDLYKTAQSAPSVCAPGCKVPASCGDGTLQAAFEQCDKGAANNDASYGKDSCKTNCQLGAYCGDGTPQTGNGEACDLGANNGKTYGASSCGYDCQPGKRCGDGILNDVSEKCDDGVMNGSITSHCSVTCGIVPYCGDGDVKAPEQCDYGQFAMDPPDYGGCSTMCTLGPSCGDGMTDPEEECDKGAANNDQTYNGCNTHCGFGPRCGDGKQQAGEACDNGFNADDYDDPNTPAGAECGKDCTLPPNCGDMVIQPAYELCDDGANNKPVSQAYGICTDKCQFGPYCGDGHIDMVDATHSETCDNGAKNVFYAAQKGGCGYDCEPAPYCGDAERNGPEQCDLGADKNDGAYGGCNVDCTFGPRCGDGKKDAGEQCDDGPGGSLKCSSVCKRRDIVQ
jgi:cysteine-rich repeat protein